MLDTLVAAFEEHEFKMQLKEMEEADKHRKEAPSLELAEHMNQFKAALEVTTAITAAPPPIPPRTHSAPIPVYDTKPVTSPTVLREVTLEDFHFIAVLGRGAFGKVMLASEKRTNQLYAVKALKKEFIVQNDDIRSLKLEKKIFQAASEAYHPFMVNLHSSFDTPGRVYFVMEYVAGGDLMCHIQERKRFHQGRARFYACEVLTAIQYFHANGIIYRDLKLDNILLCADGHIKVADYGICKENMTYGSTTATFCGTPDYMAPEILMNRKYGISVDWWSFGVLIYVMLVGSVIKY
jgi:serine/threonine protein kinase